MKVVCVNNENCPYPLQQWKVYDGKIVVLDDGTYAWEIEGIDQYVFIPERFIAIFNEDKILIHN